MIKSYITPEETMDLNHIGRSYYVFCLEQALANLQQARMIVSGDRVDTNHQLPTIERLLQEAIDAS